jgi:hypothetical protein
MPIVNNKWCALSLLTFLCVASILDIQILGLTDSVPVNNNQGATEKLSVIAAADKCALGPPLISKSENLD